MAQVKILEKKIKIKHDNILKFLFRNFNTF